MTPHLLRCLAMAFLLVDIPAVAAAEPERVNIALVAMRSEMGQPAANLDRVAEFSRKAQEQGATFVVFTEECITGSLNKSTLKPGEILWAVEQAERLALPRLKTLARERRQTLIVGTITKAGEKFRNTALVVGPEGLLATYHKLWLPGGETKFFVAGTELPVIESQGWKFSVGICADLNRGEYFDAASCAGAELFLLPIAGSGYPELVSPNGDQAKQAAAHRKLHEPIMRNWGKQHALYVGYANQSGHSGTDWFPALSLAVDPNGELLGVHEATEGMLVVEAARAAVTHARSQLKRAAVEPDLKNSAGEPVKVVRVKSP